MPRATRFPASAIRTALWALTACALGAGCGGNELLLDYKLAGLSPADVARVETRVVVDPSDPRAFYVDQPFRQVAPGVGYEVRDFDGNGKRTLLITHEAALGYVFDAHFEFRLLPPPGGTQAPPLSVVARAVGTSDLIGQTAPVMGSFGRGQTLTLTLGDQRCGAMSCDANAQCCAGQCAAVQADAENCGGCGQACAPTGDSCSGAACRCAGGSACGSGSTCCGGVGCIDLRSDPFHCGACDKACAPGETCVAGACSCGSGGACTAPSAVCCPDGTCHDNGVCPCGGTSCTVPELCCGGACDDTRTSPTNCGVCGRACAAPLVCANGACTCKGIICAATDTCCDTGCANTANDPNNCGACGKQCGAGEVCSGGQCLCGATACGPAQLCCGGSCLTQGINNCGSCGHVCKSGESCAGAAANGDGVCACNGGDACVGNQVCCAAGSAGGAGCFDLSSDPQHCGDCGKVCGPGQACNTGHCVASPCNPPCANGNQCVNGQCRCNGSGGCNGRETCCSDGCQDLANDPQNCNQCGHVCTGGAFCCKGACTVPDNKNCKECGQACSSGTSCCACPGKDPTCAALCLCL